MLPKNDPVFFFANKSLNRNGQMAKGHMNISIFTVRSPPETGRIFILRVFREDIIDYQNTISTISNCKIQ